MDNLIIMGANFRSAPLTVRERLSFPADQIPGILQRLRWQHLDHELVLLSTCNRTEVYLAGRHAHKQHRLIHELLGQDNSCDTIDELAPHLYRHTGRAAVEHLFAVASSLDSMVLGETEILGQVRRAYTLAHEHGATGPMLNRLFQAALKIAKRVHTETHLCEGRVSVSSVAVEFAKKTFGRLDDTTVLIIGAGQTGELALQCLVKTGVGHVLVANRSSDRAAELAHRYRAQSILITDLHNGLRQADIVVAATHAPHVVITADAVREAMRQRSDRRLLLIDLAMPRNIDPHAGTIDHVHLCNIDDMQAVADGNLARRRTELDTAAVMIRDAVDVFVAQSRHHRLTQLAERLKSTSYDVLQREIAEAFRSGHLATLDTERRQQMKHIMERTIDHLLSVPKEAMKQMTHRMDEDDAARVIETLFRWNAEADDDTH
jgi:glutamyl-tRNA reductase